MIRHVAKCMFVLIMLHRCAGQLAVVYKVAATLPSASSRHTTIQTLAVDKVYFLIAILTAAKESTPYSLVLKATIPGTSPVESSTRPIDC